MRGVDVRIGDQTRTLLFTAKAAMAVKAWMPGNVGVREALAFHRDTFTVAICIAAALLHADNKMTPGRAMRWIDDELRRYPEFEAKVTEAAKLYYREAGIIEDDEGEARPPATNATSAASSANGSSTSASPADTASASSTSTGEPSST